MANPQPENGHIDIANTIADKLCSYRLNGQEWQIIWVVLRKTWGWLTDPKDKNSPKKKMDRIALSQFAKLTGINRSRCHAILKGLITKDILKKTVTQKCNTTHISYGFQKNYDLWKVLPKSATVTKKCNRVLPKSATKVLPKSATTKETLKETLTKEKKIKRKTFLPEDYKLKEKHIEYAKQKGITENLDDLFEGFCINHKKRGTQFVSWYAAWQTWVRNKIEWAKKDKKEDKYDF